MMLNDRKHVRINDDGNDLRDDLISNNERKKYRLFIEKSLTRCLASSLSNAKIAKTANTKKTTPRILDVCPFDDEDNT
jgi:hypothetical protein